MATWPSYLPLFRVGLSSKFSNNVVRSNLKGKTTQRISSQRSLEIASISLVLTNAQVPLFEYFVQTVLNDGQDFFTGSFIENGQVTTGPVRFLDGKYEISANSTNSWTVTGSIEIQR